MRFNADFKGNGSAKRTFVTLFGKIRSSVSKSPSNRIIGLIVLLLYALPLPAFFAMDVFHDIVVSPKIIWLLTTLLLIVASVEFLFLIVTLVTVFLAEGIFGRTTRMEKLYIALWHGGILGLGIPAIVFWLFQTMAIVNVGMLRAR
jgi:hypothetical protein